MRRLILLPALAASLTVQAADLPYGRLFYTPEQRAALENARRRNIRAEELAAEAAKQPKKVPGPRKVMVTGVVQRSDGGSFAWINGKPVESETNDGLRVRHGAGTTGVVVYDPEKRRTVSVKVGQEVDLNTGRIEESYETRRAAARAEAQAEALAETTADSAPARKETAKASGQRPASGDNSGAASDKTGSSGDKRGASDDEGADGDKSAADTDNDGNTATEGARNAEGAKQGG